MNTVTICGYEYERQEVNAFLQFQIIQAVEEAYSKYGADSGLTSEQWLTHGVQRFDKNVVMPLLDIAFVPVGTAPPIGKVMLSRTFGVDDFKAITEALQSFSSSVTGNSGKQSVTRKTSAAKLPTKKKART